MALTLNLIAGAETEGLEEVTTTAGSPTIETSSPILTGAASFELTGAATQARIAFEGRDMGVALADTNVGVGCAVQFTDLSPGTEYEFLWGHGAGMSLNPASAGWSLFLETDGDVRFEDANGTTIGTTSSPFTVNTRHYISIYYQASETGAFDILIDGTNVLSSSTEGTQDFIIGKTPDGIACGGPGSGDGTVYVDDIYIYSGVTGASDLHDDFQVFGYQSGLASATPDTGGDLDTGTWALTGQSPLNAAASNVAIYTADNTGHVLLNDSNAAGRGPGPSGGSPDVSGTIVGAVAINHMRRDGGGGTDHRILFGNNTDGVTASANLGATTSYATYFFLSESASIVPTASEVFRLGFDRGQVDPGGMNFDCADMWAMLGHVPSAVIADDEDAWFFTPGSHQPVIEPDDIVSY